MQYDKIGHLIGVPCIAYFDCSYCSPPSISKKLEATLDQEKPEMQSMRISCPQCDTTNPNVFTSAQALERHLL